MTNLLPHSFNEIETNIHDIAQSLERLSVLLKAQGDPTYHFLRILADKAENQKERLVFLESVIEPLFDNYRDKEPTHLERVK